MFQMAIFENSLTMYVFFQNECLTCVYVWCSIYAFCVRFMTLNVSWTVCCVNILTVAAHKQIIQKNCFALLHLTMIKRLILHQ